MFNTSWKSQLSSCLAVVALACIVSPVQAQSIDRGLASQLADIAFGYAQVQQPEKAIALLEQAETYEGDDCFEAIAWLKIGVAYQAASDQAQGEKFLTKAVETAAERTSENCHSSATSPIESFLNRAAEYAEAGHLDLALQLATRIDDFFEPMTLTAIAAEYAEVGQRRKAEQILTQAITDHRALVDQLTRDDPDSVPASVADSMLVLMTSQLLEAGQPELAKFVVEQSGLIPTQLPNSDQTSENAVSDIDNYLLIARLLPDLQQPQQVVSLLDSIVPSIQLSPQYPMEAIYSWVGAAQIYHQLGSSQAIEVLEQAQTSLAQSNSQVLSSAQAQLARGYAEIGEFDQALALSESIDDVSQRQVAYGAIAAAYAGAGLPEEADSLIKSIGNPQFARADMLRAYLETEQYAEAEQVAQQPDMIDFLPEVGRTYCEAGLLEKAVTLINQSPTADWLRECVATQFARQGEFERALALVQPIEAPDYKADALTQIAIRYASPAADSRWQRFWQRWFGGDRSESAVEVLDQALSLVQPKT